MSRDALNPQQFYHVAPHEYREEIEHHGLDYRKGHPNFDYESLGQPRGNYVFGSQAAANQEKSRRDDQALDNGGDFKPHDVWKVRHSEKRLLVDPDPNAKKSWRSRYTTEPIPPEHMERLSSDAPTSAKRTVEDTRRSEWHRR